MPKCTQVCPHGAGEEDLAAEVPADPDPVPTASAADPMGKRGTGHWPLEHFSLNVAFWACLRSHCIKRCSKHHCLRFQCSSNRILVLAADLLGNRPETTNFFFSLGPGPTPWARAGRTPSPRRQPQTPAPTGSAADPRPHGVSRRPPPPRRQPQTPVPTASAADPVGTGWCGTWAIGCPGIGQSFGVEASGWKLPGGSFRVEASGWKLPGGSSRVDASGSKLPGGSFRVVASGSRLPGGSFRVEASGSRLRGRSFRVKASGSKLRGRDFGVEVSGSKLRGRSFGVEASGSKLRGRSFGAGAGWVQMCDKIALF